jgi:hypothetical protein
MPDSTTLPAQRALIARAILSTSPVTRLGIACPSERLRERAADDLAQEIVDRLLIEASQLQLGI